MASRELSGVGGAIRQLGAEAATQGARLMGMSQIMTSMGIGFAGAGAAGLSFFNETANAASEFNTQAALTLTQTDGIGTNLGQLKDIAKEVAKEIPAPFEEMQGALYDIFSSMDIDANGAYMLLREFSQAAVAGQTDLATAAQGTIGVLNAFGMEASDVTRVNDVMFQLVRKGVGTYEEFASSIGMATPAAVRSGQSIETLAGMMAFLTRNGLSTSTAAASAGRALESMANAKTVERMEAMGISVRDANGEYRPMVDIVGQLSAKLGHLPGPERVAILQELFKGAGGTIQARRFWDTAIQNFDEFNQRVGEMTDSAGAMDEAYGIMFDSPQVKIQQLKNQYAVLATEIGDNVLPIKLKLAEILLSVLEAWNNLSPGVQKAIVMFGLIASVVGVVVGAFLLIGGAILGFMALLSFAGITLGGFALAVGGVILVLALLAGAAYLIYQNWDTIKPLLMGFWEDVKRGAMVIWDAIKPKIDQFVAFVRRAVESVRAAWNTWWPEIVDTWNKVVDIATRAWERIQEVINQGVEVFKQIWATLGPALAEMDIFGTVYGFLEQLWTRVQEIAPQVIGAFQNVVGVVGMVVMTIVDAVSVGLGILSGLWDTFGQAWLGLVTGVWGGIKGIIQGAIDVVTGILQAFFALINGDWGALWDAVKQIVEGAWSIIKGIIEIGLSGIFFIWDAALALIRAAWDWLWETVKTKAGEAWEWLKQKVQEGVHAVVTFFQDLPGKIREKLQELYTAVKTKAEEIMGALKTAVQEKGEEAIDWFKSLPTKIQAFLSGAVTWLYGAGRDIMEGLLQGLRSMWDGLTGLVGDIAGAITGGLGDWLDFGSPSKVMRQYGKWTAQGLIEGMASMEDAVRLGAISMVNPIATMPVPELAGVGAVGGASKTLQVTVAEGAVQLDMSGASLSTPADKEEVQKMIDEAFDRLVEQIERDL